MPVIIIPVLFCLFAGLGILAAKYFLDQRRYLRQARQFSKQNGLHIKEISLDGPDVALWGTLDGRSVKMSVVQMSVDADTTEAVGYYFESYHIEVNIDHNQQWLALMDFRHHDEERLESPEMPHYSTKFKTTNPEFDKKYFLFANAKPSHPLFGNPMILKELVNNKLRVMHANNGKLDAYFDRPIIWKYSAFGRVENLIRLTMKIASHTRQDDLV